MGMIIPIRMVPPITIMRTDPGLILHQIFSPAFPVGAFAYSHGLETAVQSGAVHDAATLEGWLRDVLEHGAGWSDAVILARAAQGEDIARLSDLAVALGPSAERRQETLLQGQAFAETAAQVWGLDIETAAYPVAVGQAAGGLQLPLAATVRLYLLSVASNLCGAGVRLIPLGQTEGQRIISALQPLCVDLAERAIDASEDDIGGFAPMLDIQSQRHDTLYSRLFRS